MEHRKPSLLMVAGEPSGDLHGSRVVARLRDLAPDLTVYGVGGDRMAEAGMELSYHAGRFAMVGFVEVLAHVPRLKRAMDSLVGLARARGTRAAILIDYPGFNLMLADRLRRCGVKVLYYISPQVWAWGARRVRKIARRVDRMAVVFDFERDFYEDRGMEAEFVGHPLLEIPELASEPPPRNAPGRPPHLGLLPGSRRQEVLNHLPAMLGAADLLRERLGELSVSVAPVDERAEELIRGSGTGSRIIDVLEPGRTYELMRTADALLVSSGTATLEAACFGTPMVIVYKTSPLTYFVGRLLVRIENIGLVNVVAGEQVVPELIQGDVRAGLLADAVAPFLTDAELVRGTSRRLLRVRRCLGTPGASERVARMALEMMGATP